MDGDLKVGGREGGWHQLSALPSPCPPHTVTAADDCDCSPVVVNAERGSTGWSRRLAGRPTGGHADSVSATDVVRPSSGSSADPHPRLTIDSFPECQCREGPGLM